MAVKTRKTVLYHVPKTGGITAKMAIRRAGLRYDRCLTSKGMHPFGLYREHSTPRNTHEVDGLYSVAFVRHPVDWYRSFYAYRIKTEWLDNKFPADRVWDDEINKFVNNVIEEYGDLVSQLYQYYVGPDCDWVDFIGKQERMLDDLAKALVNAGEEFDKEKLMTVPWRNRSASRGKWGRHAVLDAETEDRILDTERWTIEKFYA